MTAREEDNQNTCKWLRCPYCGSRFADNIADLDLEPEGAWRGVDR